MLMFCVVTRNRKFLAAILPCFLTLLASGPAEADIVRRGNRLLTELLISKNDLAEGAKLNIKGFAEGGQFEVPLNSGCLPVATPKCTYGVVVRMPWTDPSSKNAKSELAEKRRLYDELEKLKAGQLKNVQVVIDVAPYGKVTQKTPLHVRLTECNVFFVVSNGHVLRKL